MRLNIHFLKDYAEIAELFFVKKSVNLQKLMQSHAVFKDKIRSLQ